MDISKLPLFSLISQRMSWLSDRQRVLADNVANADTPGYRARDLAPQDFGAALKSVPGPATTSSMHLSGSAGAGGLRSRTTRSNAKMLSGNTVSVNQEMMKIAETANDFSLVTNLYRKQLGMLRAVLSRNS